jgi:spermidine synthase
VPDSEQLVTGDRFSAPRNTTTAIFLLSVLTLFVEMMLIRWVGTEIRIFAYLQNTILVVCFLGLGMGCFTAQRPIDLRVVAGGMIVIALTLSLPWPRSMVSRITEYLSVLGDFLIWQSAAATGFWDLLQRVAVGLAMTFALMWLMWWAFLHQGRLLGRLMDRHTDVIRGYSSNVAGSLVGIWLFAALSAWETPPWVWLAISGLLLLPFLQPRLDRLAGAIALLGVVALTAWYPSGGKTRVVIWSPYQKLVLQEASEQTQTDRVWSGQYYVLVNNVGYQGIIDLSRDRVAKDPRIPEEYRGFSQYDVPLRFKPNPQHVLIVGAGSGNDVAGALRGNASRVTAVEIDPAIIRLGRQYHPERPYDSERVTVVNDDARAFFASTRESFDLIIFGLLDSHTTTAMTNARLDHYVYTLESIERARQLLTPDGVMVLSFEAQKSYIVDRMAGCLRTVFGEPPLIFKIPANPTGWGGVLFVAGNSAVVRDALTRDQELAALVERWDLELGEIMPYLTPIATDDWPYIYLSHRRIPMLHALLAALLVGLAAIGRWQTQTPVFRGWDKSRWHFFFLGAAFMLLEVQNISKAAVVLGNTWQVNAVIISGILVMILLANTVAARFPDLHRYAAVPLVVICLLLYWVDLASFASLPYLARAAVIGSLTTLPMLFSGLLFIGSLARTEQRDAALGANLMGALAGGVLQSLTFLVGIKALLLIVVGFYVIAAISMPRATTEALAPVESRGSLTRGRRKRR